jgi:hypothetical protein
MIFDYGGRWFNLNVKLEFGVLSAKSLADKIFYVDLKNLQFAFI